MCLVYAGDFTMPGQNLISTGHIGGLHIRYEIAESVDSQNLALQQSILHFLNGRQLQSKQIPQFVPNLMQWNSLADPCSYGSVNIAPMAIR